VPGARFPVPGARFPVPCFKCGKLVKLFAYGTKVLSLIPRHFHHNNRKDIWPDYPLQCDILNLE
jgi:hypothetical protein